MNNKEDNMAEKRSRTKNRISFVTGLVDHSKESFDTEAQALAWAKENLEPGLYRMVRVGKCVEVKEEMKKRATVTTSV